MFYTYVILSKKDNKCYIGWTANLKIRIQNHNSGLVVSIKNRRPLVLIYYEACLSKIKAIDREMQLKIGFGMAYLKRRLEL